MKDLHIQYMFIICRIHAICRVNSTMYVWEKVRIHVYLLCKNTGCLFDFLQDIARYCHNGTMALRTSEVVCFTEPVGSRPQQCLFSPMHFIVARECLKDWKMPRHGHIAGDAKCSASSTCITCVWCLVLRLVEIGFGSCQVKSFARLPVAIIG